MTNNDNPKNESTSFGGRLEEGKAEGRHELEQSISKTAIARL